MTKVIESLCGWCGGNGESQSSWLKPCPHCDGSGIEYIVVNSEVEVQPQTLDDYEYDEIPF